MNISSLRVTAMSKSLSAGIRPVLAIVLFAATSVVLAQQSVTEEFPFTYLGLQAGVHDVDQWPATIAFGNAVNFEGGVTLKEEPAFGLQIGREYENSRYEVEYQRGTYEVGSINLNAMSEKLQGDTGHYEALTLNALRMHDFTERFTGYMGLGIGMGKALLPAQGFSGGCQCFPEARESGFVWQARVGLEYRVGERARLGMHYSRLFNIPGPLWEDSLPAIFYDERDVDVLALSFRWLFQRSDS